MCSAVRKLTGFVGIAALGLVVSGCYQTFTGTEELCNYRDDNWNDIIDDPFVDEAGGYFQVEHCGGCGIDCEAVFPSAEEVACELTDLGYSCEIVACPEGTHLIGSSACVPIQDISCLTCTVDSDCKAAMPKAACVSLPFGDKRCLNPCDEDDDCSPGFFCNALGVRRFCVPLSGHCACTPDQAEIAFGCWVQSPTLEEMCYGTQVCDGEALSLCEPIYEELCDGKDNDCDGRIDEGFTVNGVYLTDEHCGACHHPCDELAPNTVAECRNLNGVPTCVRECQDHHVDLDGLSLNGCECFKVVSVWPPASFGGDMDCDGSVDSTADFIFVSKTGDDANPGTLEAPVATVDQGIALAGPRSLAVIVAQGTYDETVVLREGVSVFGGYRSDFGDYNVDLFEVVVESTTGERGHPVLIGKGIRAMTEISGLTLKGSDGEEAGGGTTTAFILDSNENLLLHEIKIIAGAATDGNRGRSSSEMLEERASVGLSSLDGVSGSEGEGGFDSGVVDCVGELRSGGLGGDHICPLSGIEVSGGDGGDSSCPDTGCLRDEPCPNAGCEDFTVDGECDFEAMQEAAIPNPPGEAGLGPNGGSAGPQTYDAPTTRDGSNYCADEASLLREGGNGGVGLDGADGQGGLGCRNGLGDFDLDTGMWTTAPGTPGKDGTDGSGGGGGTEGNGYDVLPWNSIVGYTDRIGGSGGGGGSGGCGAPGAEEGTGGGSSIGLAIILTASGSGPIVQNVRIIPARAGDGGDGGLGAAGGAPGTGANGGDGNFWCARRGGRGGDGGAGGSGGGGGGGCGGSISGFHVMQPLNVSGEAYVDLLEEFNYVDPLPAPGSGGNGGFSPGNPGEDGLAGTADAYRLFSIQVVLGRK